MMPSLGDIALVGALPSADEVVDVVSKDPPDIVVLDLTMPGRDPVQAIADLAAAHPSVKCVVYSAHSGAEALLPAHRAGAKGYIDKLSLPNDIGDVLRRVHAGEVVFPAHARLG